MAPVFEWDGAKDASNQDKHGISFREASEAFLDLFNITIADPNHAVEEERFVLLGFAGGKLLVISFTERSNAIRTISCRKANTKERRLYEGNQ
jgi:uncharacterized DUF497 family protein